MQFTVFDWRRIKTTIHDGINQGVGLTIGCLVMVGIIVGLWIGFSEFRERQMAVEYEPAAAEIRAAELAEEAAEQEEEAAKVTALREQQERRNAIERERQRKKRRKAQTIWRTWKTIDGKYSVNAKHVSHNSASVTIERKDDGQQVTFEFANLSSSDREYLRRNFEDIPKKIIAGAKNPKP